MANPAVLQAIAEVDASVSYRAPRPFPGQRHRDVQIAYVDGCRVIQEAFGDWFTILVEPCNAYPEGRSISLTGEQFYAVQRAVLAR